jgi:hypothetical protein
METHEISDIVSVIENNQRKKDVYNGLKDRSLLLIPVDSQYYHDFQMWRDLKYRTHLDKKEEPRIYIQPKEANIVVDALIKNIDNFLKPFQEKLKDYLIENKEELKRVSEISLGRKLQDFKVDSVSVDSNGVINFSVICAPLMNNKSIKINICINDSEIIN